jgi:hypothetical protein
MKWMVLKYIEILIAYGDSLFQQNTLETIPRAIQLYILASHLYGPRGQKVPQRQPTKRYTYNMLATRFDAFSNAIVQMEQELPFSSDFPASIGAEGSAPISNIFGSLSSLIFAIPDNPQMRKLAETIDDRLFKIRHSQDINGIFRQLPLFEPPIDPALLVQAAAQGVSISSVVASLNGPMPNHRFQYLLQRAVDLATEVKSLGQALLSLREKQDAEVLSVLRSQHEAVSQKMLIELKTLAVDEANKSIEVLQQNRKGAVNRLRFYLSLVGGESSGIPEIDQDFNELDTKVETPIEQGGLKLSPYEAEEFEKLTSAREMNVAIQALETAASVLHMLPNATMSFQPMGVGTQLLFGPGNLAEAASATARGLGFYLEKLNFEANMAGRKGQFQRALQERILQANTAGYEVANIDKQILTAKIRMSIAQKEIDMQQKTVEQASEVLDFMRTKYTQKELYTWMEGATKELFHDAYSQAVSLAFEAQQLYKFERPNSDRTFIEGTYWDASRDGLLSGERLYLALRRLEVAYASERGHDFEITKTVSLRRIDPMALISLREKGSCEFSVPEILYDMDFPGHYMRRIKAVSLTLPCLVGPYTNVNATLQLRTNKIRKSPSLSPQYLESPDPAAEPDSRFINAAVPISAIAVSTAQNDTGVFELNFKDDSYMPFEGAGAVSSWQLELPPFDVYRPFDYDTITDVVMQIRYTSTYGGDEMKRTATNSVNNYFKAGELMGTSGGLVAIYDIKNDFASAWARVTQTSTGSEPAGGRVQGIDMPNLHERLPAFTRKTQPENVTATAVWILSDLELPGDVSITLSGADKFDLKKSTAGFGGLILYTNEIVNKTLGSWKVTFGAGELRAKKCWMLVRYALK